MQRTKALYWAALPLALASVSFGCTDDEKSCDTSIAGNICTVAGNGDNAYLGDDGPATEASFSLPQDTLYADDGSLYVLDWNNHRIRKVLTDGTIVHVAGRGELGGTLDDPANNDFNHPPSAIFGDSQNEMIVAAWHNSKVRTLDLTTGEVVDTCGDGRRAYFGDGGPALTATLDLPASLVRSPDDRLMILDQANQVIRAVDRDGNIDLVAGQCFVESEEACEGQEAIACPESSGKLYCTDLSACAAPCQPGFGGDGGPATAMRMSQPFGQSADPGGRMVYDAEGSLIFADANNQIIRKIDSEGIVTTIAGTAPTDGQLHYGYAGDGGPATEALLDNPVDLAMGDDGTLYFTDVYNNCVRSVSPNGIINTVVGVCGERGYEGDDGPATEALLKRPYGLEIGNNTLYIADTGNMVIRAVPLP